MIAGLTGHQKIGDELTILWVRDQLAEAVTAWGVTEGCMSLAIGADQMYAELLLDRGLPYRVVVPCERYGGTFSDEERQRYFFLLSKAKSVIALGFVKPTERAFYEAGKEVVNTSEMLIAIWDGREARGLGGTADIVGFARASSKRVLHIDTVGRVVKMI